MTIHELADVINHCSGIEKIYILAMLVGLFLPAINLLLSGITTIFDIDFNFDTNGSLSDFLPLKPMCILIFLLTFGGFGLIANRYLSDGKSLIIAVLAGYIFALTLNILLIKPMSKELMKTHRIENLIGESCDVLVRIRVGSVGSVSIKSKYGIITYTAALDTGEDIDADCGDKVKIVGVNSKEDTVIVTSLNDQQELTC